MPPCEDTIECLEAIFSQDFRKPGYLVKNPTIPGRSVLKGETALSVVNTKLAGPDPGEVLFAQNGPDPSLFDGATGHMRIMDFRLIQIARDDGYTLITRDQALNRTWPDYICLLG